MPRIRVEVVYALPGRQPVAVVTLEAGATARDAVAASGVREAGALALHGRRIQPGHGLRDGDRVEILRPLAQDPKEARRRRARPRR